MKDTEVKAKIILDDMPLSALYKVSETHTHTGRVSSDSSCSATQREKAGKDKQYNERKWR